MPKRKPLAEVRIGGSIVKVYDKEVLDMYSASTTTVPTSHSIVLS